MATKFQTIRKNLTKKRIFSVGSVEFQDPIVLCMLLYLLRMRDYNGMIYISLLASCLHEVGHIAVYYIYCKKLPSIRVSAFGLCMKTQGAPLSRERLCVLAVAGPAVNFLLAIIWIIFFSYHATLQRAAFFSANILIGLFNFIPVYPLDGAVILQFFYENWKDKLQLHQK